MIVNNNFEIVFEAISSSLWKFLFVLIMWCCCGF